MSNQKNFSLGMSGMNCKNKSNFIITLLLDLNVKFEKALGKSKIIVINKV